MANVAKINGYDVKDAEARGDIADIQQDLSTAQGDITTLQGDVSDTKADLGDITALSTTVKTSAVNAINEVNGKTEDNADNIGTLANLTTTANTDLVSAINEVDSHADTNTTNIGNLSRLNTVDKSDIVSAVNEVERNASYRISKNTYNFAPTFSDETSYAVGDYVTYNGVLYKCTTAHTAGVWVAGHFTAVTVGGDFVGQGSAPTLDNGTRIGLDKLDLRKLGLGDVQYNKIYMEVINTREVPGTPITGEGHTLYMKLGLIEFAIGPISADATQWSPQTLAYVRINFSGTGYSNWKEL